LTRPRKDIMLAHPLQFHRLESWPKPIIAQPKLNGWRLRALIEHVGTLNPKVTLFSSTARIVESVPHIKLALEEFARESYISVNTIELDGELYIHGMPFNEISSIASPTVRIHPDFESMQYHIFDMPFYDVQHVRTSTLYLLSQLFKSPLHFVPHQLVTSLEDIQKYLADCMDEKYEGIILRHPEAQYIRKKVYTILKLKPRKMDAYRIIGYTEEVSIHGRPKGTLGSFVCQKDNQTFRVGSGRALTKESRQRFWDNKTLFTNGRFYAVVKYPELTGARGVPNCGVLWSIIHEDDLTDEHLE